MNYVNISTGIVLSAMLVHFYL